MAASPPLSLESSQSSLEDGLFIWPTLPIEGFEDHWLQVSSTSSDTSHSDEGPSQLEPGQPLCSGCEENPGERYCTKCNVFQCLACCADLPTHRGEFPKHPVVSYQEHRLFKQIVNDQAPDELLKLQHEEDFLSLWFSIDKGEHGTLQLQEFPRFSKLVKDHQEMREHESDCSALLVSFIGNTGAGKSTLIRVLMKQPWDMSRLASTGEASVSLPIAGRSGSTIPTSGDVHLYPAPSTATLGPLHLLLYADCEGFNGGHRPEASRAKRSVFARMRGVIETKTTESLIWTRYIISFLRGTHVFPLGFESTREEAVKNLFPRLLYNFSDVVVYVMPDAASRMMEHVIVNLLEWAQNSQRTAVNRVILPHLVVVLNTVAGSVDDWDTDRLTTSILGQHLEALECNEVISTYRRMLNKLRDTPIKTVRELLRGCYSSVQFIRVPSAEKQHLFSQQVRTLDSLIREATDKARHAKTKARCLLDAETHNKLFSMAFEHYRNNLEKPFDFLESLLAAKPLDSSLSVTLFGLLRAALAAYRLGTPQLCGSEFCSMITPTVCSTIALDSYRSNGKQPGKLKNVYAGSTLHSRVGEGCGETVTYQSQLGDAIQDFLEHACPCDFVFGDKKCVNSFQGHQAFMHQDEAGNIQFGTFESKFVDDWAKCWNNEIDACIAELDGLLENPDAEQLDESITLWYAHCQNLRSLYSSIPQLRDAKPEGCSWCFHGKSQGVLECGHRICWACAELAGDLPTESPGEDEETVTFQSCYLHPTVVRFEEANRVIKERETAAIVLSKRT